MIYIGIDDTDNPTSRGTGLLARNIARELSDHFKVFGVTRHQHSVHESIPYTSHNSSACIHLDEDGKEVAKRVFGMVKKMMLDDFIEGSDPGLVVATRRQINSSVVVFGLDTKIKVVTQPMARDLAKNCGILLEGLGGTEDGVIGALGGVGLASTGFDGSFLIKGKSREINGEYTIDALKKIGIDRVMTVDGKELTTGSLLFKKSPNPSFIRGEAIILAEESCDGYHIVKRQ
jgi:tRNA(Ile2) C34 agmatinyltransferase TiaS